MHFPSLRAGMLALLIAVSAIPVGCGGAQVPGPRALRPEGELPTMRKEPNVEVPEATVRQMEACVHARASQWSELSYALQYDITADTKSSVLKVKLRDATIKDALLEECFKRAMAAMRVPGEALRLR
jgi:hypothetical protein